jgi:GWxTD domain-containing protein
MEAKIKKALGLLAILTLLYPSATTEAVKKRNMDKYEHCLKEEVALLITQEEKAEFMKIKTDEEKDKFIEIFWAKRDPSPRTKENDFKDEWYQRLEHVKKTFTLGSKKRWRSDMGKVYMFFGPPSQTTSKPPRTRREPMGGTQLEPAPQIWIYQPMPDLGLTSSFRVVFREYQYGYDLDHQTPQSILRSMEIFPRVVIFNPDIKELPRYRFFLDKESFEGKLINNFMATGKEVKEISLEWKPIFTRALNRDTHVSFLIHIDTQQFDRKKFKEMTFFGKIKGEGDAEEDFLKSVKTEKAKKDKPLATFGLPVKPGKSVLYLGAIGSDKENYSLLKSELDVPNFWNDELGTGSLILSHEVVSASKSERGEEFNPYIVGQFKATPRWGNVLKQSEFLSVLFHIYNARLENDAVSLKVEYFITSAEVAYKLNPQEIKEKVEPGKTLAGGTEISLSPLKPGKYTFKIKITDRNANKSIEKTADFTVE